jgi:hypothetical protein
MVIENVESGRRIEESQRQDQNFGRLEKKRRETIEIEHGENCNCRTKK